MKMSAERYVAEIAADRAFFKDNFLYTCLNCPAQGMYDDITTHCATIHHNNNFEITWPELADRMTVMAGADEVTDVTGAQDDETVLMTEAIQEIINDMTRDGNSYDVYTVDEMLEDAEEIIAEENARNAYEATRHQDH